MSFENQKSNGVNNVVKVEGATLLVDENLIDQIVQVAVRTTIETMGHISAATSGNLPKNHSAGGGFSGKGSSRPCKAAPNAKPRTRKAQKNFTPPDAFQLVVEAAEVFCVPASDAAWSKLTGADAIGVLRGLAQFEPMLGLVRQSHIIARLARSTSKVRQRTMFGYIKLFFTVLKRIGWWLGPNPTVGIDIEAVPVATTRTRLGGPRKRALAT